MRRSWARSRLSITVLMARKWRPSGRRLGNGSGRSALALARLLGPQPALLAAPLVHARMVPRQQHLGHRPAAPVGRPRVVRVLGRALQGNAERLLVSGFGVA